MSVDLCRLVHAQMFRSPHLVWEVVLRMLACATLCQRHPWAVWVCETRFIDMHMTVFHVHRFGRRSRQIWGDGAGIASTLPWTSCRSSRAPSSERSFRSAAAGRPTALWHPYVAALSPVFGLRCWRALISCGEVVPRRAPVVGCSSVKNGLIRSRNRARDSHVAHVAEASAAQLYRGGAWSRRRTRRKTLGPKPQV